MNLKNLLISIKIFVGSKILILIKQGLIYAKLILTTRHDSFVVAQIKIFELYY